MAYAWPRYQASLAKQELLKELQLEEDNCEIIHRGGQQLEEVFQDGADTFPVFTFRRQNASALHNLGALGSPQPSRYRAIYRRLFDHQDGTASHAQESINTPLSGVDGARATPSVGSGRSHENDLRKYAKINGTSDTGYVKIPRKRGFPPGLNRIPPQFTWERESDIMVGQHTVVQDTDEVVVSRKEDNGKHSEEIEKFIAFEWLVPKELRNLNTSDVAGPSRPVWSPFDQIR